MKIALTVVLLLLPTGAVLAQADSLRLIHGLPHTGSDTVHEGYYARPPVDRAQVVSPRHLPRRIKRVLSRNDIYQGWENGRIYFDREAERYRLYLRGDSITRVFGFDTRGNPVTYDEFDNDIDQ